MLYQLSYTPIPTPPLPSRPPSAATQANGPHGANSPYRAKDHENGRPGQDSSRRRPKQGRAYAPSPRRHQGPDGAPAAGAAEGQVKSRDRPEPDGVAGLSNSGAGAWVAMPDQIDGDYVKRMARAEELAALAARAEDPASRVLYLQLAAAFRQLAEMRGAHPPEAHRPPDAP